MSNRITTSGEADVIGTARLFSETLWYAAYTASRREKCVAQQLRDRGVENFLPLYETVHRWRNGRHRVQLPLFPGYVFVHLALRERLRALEVPGLVRLVAFNGIPYPLPEKEIEAIRSALTAGVSAQPYPYLRTGSRVEISQGPLRGMRGILLRRRNTSRVVLSLELIMRSIVVEVHTTDVVPLRSAAQALRIGGRENCVLQAPSWASTPLASNNESVKQHYPVPDGHAVAADPRY